MGNFDRNRVGGGRGRFNKSQGGRGGGGRGRPEMYQATCADCGNRCEVPFRPTGDKPVYCSDCFGGKSDSNRSGGGGRGGFGGRDRGRPQMYQATCADCGNRCEVPFRPTGDKPVYCSDCFGGKGPSQMGGPSRPDQSNEYHEKMNKKLDKIIQILERIAPPKEHVIKKKDAMPEWSEDEEAKPAKKKVAKKKAVAKKTTAKKKAPAKKKKAPAKKKATKKKS